MPASGGDQTGEGEAPMSFEVHCRGAKWSAGADRVEADAYLAEARAWAGQIRRLGSFAVQGHAAPAAAACPFDPSSPAGMAWRVGQWLRAADLEVPHDVGMYGAELFRVGVLQVLVDDSGVRPLNWGQARQYLPAVRARVEAPRDGRRPSDLKPAGAAA